MLPGDMSMFVNLIKRDWTFGGLVISMFSLALTQWVNLSYPLVLILGIILFSTWDAIVYESVAKSDNRENLVRYRIGQTSIQILTIILLGLITHWNTWVVFGFVYLWWMGVCDVMFYTLLGKLNVMLDYGDMPWLWWTPLGTMNKWLGRKTAGIEVFHITLYSAILWFALWFLLPRIHHLTIF